MFQFAFAHLQIAEFIPYQSRVAITLGDEPETAGNAVIDFVESLYGLAFAGAPLPTKVVHLRLELGYECLHQFLLAQQDILQSTEDTDLEFCRSNAECALARAAFPPGGTVVALAVYDGHGPAAKAAFHQPGEKAFPGLTFVAGTGGVAALDLLDLFPACLIDNTQVRCLAGNPFAFGVWSRNALAGFRILDEALPVIGDTADIEFIVEDAVTALTAAVDSRGVPRPTARPRDALCVQSRRDLAGRNAVCVFVEDTPDHFRLVVFDLALAGHERTVITQTADDPVTVTVATRDLASRDPPALSPSCLVGEIFQEQRVHSALEADMELADLTFRQGHDTHLRMAQALEDGSDIFLVATDAVECLGNQDVEHAALGSVQKCQHAGART